MRQVARQLGLERIVVPVPVLSPPLVDEWRKTAELLAPDDTRVWMKLIDGLRNETIVRDARAADVFGVRPRDVRRAIAAALRSDEEAVRRSA